jgi:predicted glycogen debranching enzyme
MIEIGRDICNRADAALSREWLVTNGIGGYAAGTVAGALTRSYHGLLVAALGPPLGRTLLLAKLDESVRYGGETYLLFANQWNPETIEPRGFIYLDRFHLEGTTPVWTYALGDALLEKRVWMGTGANTTYVRYDFVRGRDSLAFTMKAIVNHRDHHGGPGLGDKAMQVERVEDGLRFQPGEQADPFYLLSDGAEAEPKHEWYRDFYLREEAYRGLEPWDDHLYAGDFSAELRPGGSLTLVTSTEPTPTLDGGSALQARKTYEAGIRDQSELSGSGEGIQQLLLAADQFIVDRPSPDDDMGKTVIAGYPWFGDWGRDTMIALPGLTLATGRPDIAGNILRTYARFVDRGMIPNRFPEDGRTPEYNTVDATLWYFEALRAYVEHSADEDTLRELFPILKRIIVRHREGTRHDIHVDPDDGLLYAGEQGEQLTWMDAKVDDWVVTPRRGKPVEVNALWYNALRVMADFVERLGEEDVYTSLAERAAEGFARFWNRETGYCYDVIDGPEGDDPALRPNQLLAVSLPHSPLSPERRRAVVDVCARRLLTPHGLRSLAPSEPDYQGRYGGDRRQRDGAYHRGTVWAWLIGPFVQAHLRVYNDPALARSYLEPLLRHLHGHGLGSISEIFDGDPPFTPRGCFAQAWSVAAVLRAWQITEANEGE